ncbi:DNA-directed RNA polymerase subunit omega [uncultured Neglectibacter sp.]|uniref:DNA-directed RNA polymerase subunit omega n=1 Tax=uncultured Neglectibacter sp. TaxID=1924108 RepID=UPI0034DDF4E0
MLKPSDNMIRTPHRSYYSLVIAVAKRARQIAEKAEEEGEILTDKPVDMAVHDFVDNKFKIIEPDSFEDE